MELPIAHAFLQMRRDARRCYSAREALPGHGRHAPDVERLIMKSVPDGTTRPTMLTYGATDLAYFLDGPEAEAAKRDPPLELVATRHASILWVEFSDQRDPKSLSHDTRLRMAVSYALDRKATSEAACLIYRTPGR